MTKKITLFSTRYVLIKYFLLLTRQTAVSLNFLSIYKLTTGDMIP